MLEQLMGSKQPGSKNPAASSGALAPSASSFNPLQGSGFSLPWGKQPGDTPDSQPNASTERAAGSGLLSQMSELLKRTQNHPPDMSQARAAQDKSSAASLPAPVMQEAPANAEAGKFAAESQQQSLSRGDSTSPSSQSIDSIRKEQSPPQASYQMQQRGAEPVEDLGKVAQQRLPQPDVSPRAGDLPEEDAGVAAQQKLPSPDQDRAELSEEPDLTSRLLEASGLPLQLGFDGLPEASSAATAPDQRIAKGDRLVSWAVVCAHYAHI